MNIYRVRLIDIDRGRQGRVWTELFFEDEQEAINHQLQAVARSNEANPGRMYEADRRELIEHGLTGFVNPAFGVMWCVDQVRVF